MKQKHPHYFIASSAHDALYAGAISHRLEEKGAQTFSWQNNIAPNYSSEKDYQSEIFSNINDTDFFIFIVPPYEGMGKVALMELGAAIAKKKKIISILPNNARLENAQSFGQTFNMMNANDLTPNQVADRILALAS